MIDISCGTILVGFCPLDAPLCWLHYIPPVGYTTPFGWSEPQPKTTTKEGAEPVESALARSRRHDVR